MDEEMRIEAPWEITVRKINGGYLLVWYEPLIGDDGLYREQCEFYTEDETSYMLNAITDYFGNYNAKVTIEAPKN